MLFIQPTTGFARRTCTLAVTLYATSRVIWLRSPVSGVREGCVFVAEPLRADKEGKAIERLEFRFRDNRTSHVLYKLEDPASRNPFERRLNNIISQKRVPIAALVSLPYLFRVVVRSAASVRQVLVYFRDPGRSAEAVPQVQLHFPCAVRATPAPRAPFAPARELATKRRATEGDGRGGRSASNGYFSFLCA